MRFFYDNTISGDHHILSEEESNHCARVLRLKVGDEIFIAFDKDDYEQMPNSKPFFKEFGVGIHSLKCLDKYSNLSVANFEVVE